MQKTGLVLHLQKHLLHLVIAWICNNDIFLIHFFLLEFYFTIWNKKCLAYYIY